MRWTGTVLSYWRTSCAALAAVREVILTAELFARTGRGCRFALYGGLRSFLLGAQALPLCYA